MYSSYFHQLILFFFCIQMIPILVAHPKPYAAGPGPGADADASSTHNVHAAPHSQPPRGFTDWSPSNSAFAAVAAQPAPATTNTPLHYNLSQPYTLWTHYMLNKNVSCSTYPTQHDPLRHTHIPDKDSGTSPVFHHSPAANSLS
jgi:hypothetical protein